MSDHFTLQADGPVWRFTLTRETRRNALTAEILSGLGDLFTRAELDPDVRVIVLTGAGDKAFCAGADLHGDAFEIAPSQRYGRLADLMRQSRRLTVPVIARINGACVAGGMGLLALSDLAVAHERAVFGLPEVKIGVFPAQVLALLKRLVPHRVLTELVITGDTIDATEARMAGLVNRVTTDLDGTVDALAARIGANSPTGVRRALYTLKRIDVMPFEEAAAFTESQITLAALTEDAKEGIAAFREKRPPRWPGR